MIIAFTSCSDWLIDFPESERRGNIIVNAIKNYYIEKRVYPLTLDSLVPKYLDETLKVKCDFAIINKHFKYNLSNVIPYSGCFMLKFKHKPDGQEYEYDSRRQTIKLTGIATTNNQYIEEHITFDDINYLKNKIELFYQKESKYPLSLNNLIPVYMKSFPYDTSLKYRPYDIAPKHKSDLVEYQYYQPCDTFRGDYQLYFDVNFGQYRYENNSEKVFWYYDD